VISGFWLKDCSPRTEWTIADCGAAEVWICSDPVSCADSTAADHWRWWVCFL